MNPQPKQNTGQEAPTAQSSLLDKILEQQQETANRYRPVMSIQDLIEREKSIQYLVDHVMVEGIDYGWIPGTKPKETSKPGEYQAKPTLFKAGAERACAFFGYFPHFEIITQIESWTAEQYGEPLFYYQYRCVLAREKNQVGEGIGSATTFESKYRYRSTERVCPQCGKANIRKSKPKPGQRGEPGFYCWEKTGGCGSTFTAEDESITGQEVGKAPNPDIADVINTVQKMSQKRAYVAATLTATGLSGRFTQDLEDLPAPKQPEPPEPLKKAQSDSDPGPEPPPPDDLGQNGGKRNLTFAERLVPYAEQHRRVGDKAYYAVLANHGFEHANEVLKLPAGKRAIIYHELEALPDLADSAQEPEVEA